MKILKTTAIALVFAFVGSMAVYAQTASRNVSYHSQDIVPIRAKVIHLYHGNAALLTESLEVIQKTSAVILSALEMPVEEEPTAEPETGGQSQDN